MKENNGITLIALVVTIVVLLVLAGATITMITGNNGIIMQATKAKQSSNIARLKEQIEIEALSCIEKTGKFNKNLFKSKIEKNIKGATIQEMYNSIIIVAQNCRAIVDEISGKITKINDLNTVNVINSVEIGDVEDRKIELTWNELKQASREIANETSIGNQTTEVTIIIGNKTEALRVGDYKIVKYDGQDQKVKIIGFNTDIKSSDSSKAGITFDFEAALTTGQMNNTDTNTNGWADSKMRIETLPTILKKIKLDDGKTDLERIIEPVKKEYNLGDSSTENGKIPTTDKLWLLSCSEIYSDGISGGHGYGYCITKEGEQYKYYNLLTNGCKFNVTNEKLSNKNTWLRSPDFYYKNAFDVIVRRNNRRKTSNYYKHWNFSGILYIKLTEILRSSRENHTNYYSVLVDGSR